MANKTEAMDDTKLNAFIDSELRSAIGFGLDGDEISDERRINLEMYLNRPVGDEEEGRSKLQSSDVQDVVEALLPASLAPFISADKVVEFKPNTAEDKDLAEVQGAYINHIFTVDNDSVHIQYTWQKDAFLQKNGFVYADWCEKERMQRKYSRVDFMGLSTLVNDKEIEILKYSAMDAQGKELPVPMINQLMHSQDPAATDGIAFNVDYRRTWKEGRVKIENIPPEYVVVSKDAKNTATPRLIGWLDRVSLSDLREEGYDEDKIDGLTTDDSLQQDTSGERQAREQAQGGNIGGNNNITDPAGRMVWRFVGWVRVDYDGDGKTELRKIVRAGGKNTSGVILYNEEADEVPIIDFTSIPMTHQLFGRAQADLTRSIQEGKTSMLRMGMDATYHTVYPRWAVNENLTTEDTWNDLMLDIPGAPVRMNDLNAVAALRDAPDIGAAYQMLEYLDRMREIRTPVTRQSQGVSTDALKDKTAHEAIIEENASNKKEELITRLYAEALGKLFRLINRTVIKYQDKPRMLRLFPDREPIEIDPRYWNADMDVTVSVGLGTGTHDQKIQALQMLNNIQMGDLQLGLPTVDPEKLYNVRAKIVQEAGLTDPHLYFNDPKQAQQQGQQQQPDPKAQEAAKQAEAQKVDEAIKNAHQQGVKEGNDALKSKEIDVKYQAQKDMKAMEVAGKSQDAQAMAQASAKPTTHIQVDAKDEVMQMAKTVEQSAIRLEQMAIQNMQTNEQVAAAMIAAAQAMSAPKKTDIIMTNGRPTGAIQTPMMN